MGWEFVVVRERGGAYKLSLGPNTFVGIADVKLDPNSSLYALQKKKSASNQSIKIPNNSLILHVDHPLRVRIPEITLMRWARVDLGLVERIGDFIGEDARGEAGYELCSSWR